MVTNPHVWDTISSRTATFCSLCGVFVDPWQDAFVVHPELSWLNEIRVVRTTHMVSEPFVSGVGYLNYHQEACVPLDDARRYDELHGAQDQGAGQNGGGGGGDGDGDQETFLTAHANFNLSREYWCYVVHDACWELLRDRVDPERREPASAVGRHLFALLYNTPTNGDGALRPGHDYGGAARFQRPSRFGYFTEVNGSDLRYLTGDPREPLQHDEHYVWEAIQAVSAPFGLPDLDLSSPAAADSASPTSSSSSSIDIFRSLPNELIALILEQLASPDLCNLRLASRHVAALSGPNVLPQEFWASRFWPGREMGFVFAGPFFPSSPSPSPSPSAASSTTTAPAPRPRSRSPAPDWRLLYIKARATLSDSELFPGFRNRKRIWRVLEDMAGPLRLRLANGDHVANEPYRDPTATAAASLGPSVAVAADAIFGPADAVAAAATRDLELSCRFFEVQRLLSLRGGWARGLRLAVSFVRLDGRTYISGLHVPPPPTAAGSRDIPAGLRVGFIDAVHTETVAFSPGSSLVELEVAASAKGMTGLRFHVEGPQGSHVVSVGNMTAGGPDCGVGRLSVSETSSCDGFAVGLDACKIISVGLLETPADSELHDDDQDQSLREGPGHFAEVWNPEIPDSPCDWAVSGPPASEPAQAFNLCLDMDFGGPDGQMLEKLTRIGVLMGGYPAAFLGMAFDYSDGSRRAYGRRDYLIENKQHAAGIEQTFFIDGPGGEVVTEIEVANSPSQWKPQASSGVSAPQTIQGITLFTNRGRSQRFRLHGDGCGPYPYYVDPVTIAPPDGKAFTSFVAKVKSPGNYIYAFGGRSRSFANMSAKPASLTASPQQPLNAISHHLPLDSTTLESAEEILSYPRGFAFTAADLTNVRRIRASVGMGGAHEETSSRSRSRSAKHVSGLWIEYHDTRTPLVVGQWIREQEQEHQGPLELEPGDRITQVTTWHDVTNSYKRAKFGPVVRVRLATARGVEREFSGIALGPTSQSLTSNSNSNSVAPMAGKICLAYRENPYEYLHGILWGCNFEWDHVRVLYAPKVNMAHLSPLVPIPPMSGTRDMSLAKRTNFPTWMVREKVFMAEEVASTDTDGKGNNDETPSAAANPVVALEVSYKDVGGEPTGLTLVYRDGGREATLGARGKRPQRLELLSGEALTRMEIGLGRGNRVVCLTFRTDAGRTLRFQDEPGTTAAAAAGAGAGAGRKNTASDLLHAKAVYELAATPTTPPVTSVLKGNGIKGAEKTDEDGSVKIARHEPFDSSTTGPFVGFWAVPKRHDRSLRYMLFGPLFVKAAGA